MKKLLILFLCLWCVNAWASEDTINGHDYLLTEVIQGAGMDAPSVSPANAYRIYYDSTLDYVLLSENGGAYSRLCTLTLGGVTYLKLDASNDPLTDSLEIRKTNATSVLTLSRNQAAVASSDIVARLEAYTFDTTDPGVSAKIEALSYGTSGETGWRISTGTPSVLAEVMQIDYLGNVGIGIPWPDSPDTKLEVGNGTVSAGVIAIREDRTDGVSKVTITVPALAATYGLTLPPDDGDPGEQLTTDGAGGLTFEAAGAGGSGDALTVNTVAIDTTGDITDSTDVTWLVTDGGVGGPDLIKGYVVDDSHAHTGASLSAIDISADTNLTAGDFLTLTDDDLDVDTAAVSNGDTTHLPTCDGVYDFVSGSYAPLASPTFTGTVTVPSANFISGQKFSKSFVITNPTATADGSIWRAPVALTITAVHLLCVGNVVVGHLTEQDANGLNDAGVDGATDITGVAATNVNDDGALSNPSIDANDYIGWRTTSVTGTPTKAIITFEGYYN